MIDNCFLFQSDISLFSHCNKMRSGVFLNCFQCQQYWIVEFLRLYQSFRKRKRKSLSCGPVLDKTWNKPLLRFSCAATAKKCTRKRDAHAKLLFCQSKSIAFFLFWLLSLSLLPKLPNAVGKTCLSYLQLPSLETYFSPSICPHIKTSGALFQRFQSQRYSYLWRCNVKGVVCQTLFSG